MISIEAQNLTKTFGKIVAVDNVSFKVNDGEIFGLLGPNGAGKTTTIRMLTGLIKPDSGKALIMGYDVNEEPIKARELIGVVPEEANPYPDLSVIDNIRLVGNLYNLPKEIIDSRSTYLLKLLDLYKSRNRRARSLSKGMRQKLLIAMALISEPKILFLDEPTSGLDVLSARKIRRLIMDLKRKGVTILLTTHNVEEAGALCDRVAIMKQHIIALGNPDELKIKAQSNRYLKVIFNKSPLNDIKNILEGYEYRIVNSSVLVVCRDPSELIMRIVEYARDRKLKIIDIHTSQPSLEDVFVRLVRSE